MRTRKEGKENVKKYKKGQRAFHPSSVFNSNFPWTVTCDLMMEPFYWGKLRGEFSECLSLELIQLPTSVMINLLALTSLTSLSIINLHGFCKLGKLSLNDHPCKIYTSKINYSFLF